MLCECILICILIHKTIIMKAYCPKCFIKTEYKFSKPKFCPECGASFNASFAINKDVDSTKKSSNEDYSKIRELEEEIKKLKAISTNNFISSDEEEYGADDDEGFDTEKARRSIENFKKNKSRLGGVTVERGGYDSGISFGELMEKSSNESRSGGREEFKMIDENVTGNGKINKKGILDQLKRESSSQASIIEID